MPNSVVITRPLAQSQLLAERVAALGRDVVLFPLLEIHPLADAGVLKAALAGLSSYALVAFVSPNAIDACFSHLDGWPQEVAIAIMGEGSRAALAAHGVNESNATIFRPNDPERTDSETLLEVLDADSLRGKRILIIRGETGRELLADALRALGAEVSQIAAYRRVAPVLNTALNTQLLRLLDLPNDWIITSSEALKILMSMVAQVDSAHGVVKMQQQHLVVPHARIAETAQMLGFKHITLTGSGDEGLLAALQSHT